MPSFNQIAKKYPWASAMGAIVIATCLGIYFAIRQFPFRDIKTSEITMINSSYSKAYFIFKDFFIGLNSKEIGFLLLTLSKENNNKTVPLKLGSRTYEVSAYEPENDKKNHLIKITCGEEDQVFEEGINKGSKLAKSLFKAKPEASHFTISYPNVTDFKIATFIFYFEILHRHQQLKKKLTATFAKK